MTDMPVFFFEEDGWWRWVKQYKSARFESFAACVKNFYLSNAAKVESVESNEAVTNVDQIDSNTD